MKVQIIILLSFFYTVKAKGIFPKTWRSSNSGDYPQQPPSYENSESQQNSLLPLLALAPLALLPLLLLATTLGTSTTTGIVGTGSGVSIVSSGKRKRRDTNFISQNFGDILDAIVENVRT